MRTAREQFDRQAAHYDAQWNRWSEEPLRWMLQQTALHGTERVLDVATGTGFTALAFAPFVSRVIGLDVSPGMLQQAEKQAAERRIKNVEWKLGEAERMPFDPGSFDIVTCRIAPHHFQSVPEFLSESLRVLRPGGTFLLVDTTVPDGLPEAAGWQNTVEKLRDPSHMRNYTPLEWIAMVTAAGLTVEAADTEGGGIPITLNDWLIKAGCDGEPAEKVGQMFERASPPVAEAFQIRKMPDGDMGFVWQRVGIRAVRCE